MSGETDLRRALIEMVVGDDSTGLTAVRAVRTAQREEEIVRLAWAWRVVPRLKERVASGLTLGPEVDARLVTMAVAAAAQSTLFYHQGAAALSALEAAGVPAGAFKGVGAIATMYRTPSARMLRDVDVLIEPEHVTTAVDALIAGGFALTEGIQRKGLDGWVDMLRAPDVNLRNLFVSLRNEEGFEVDLHLRFGHLPPPRMAPAALLARRVRVAAGGVEIPVLAPVDLVLLTVYHSLKDQLALTSTARDLVDLAAWWDVGRDRWSLADMVEAANEADLVSPLLAFWLILARANPGGPVNEGVEHFEAGISQGARQDAHRIVDLFDHVCATGQLSLGWLSTMSPQRARRYIGRRRARAAAMAAVDPIRGSARHELADGLMRMAREGGQLRRLAGYRALVRAQRRYR